VNDETKRGDIHYGAWRRSSAASEWKSNWPLVLAATAGSSYATVALSSFTFFLEPLEQEFGWSRAEVLSGNTIYAVLTIMLSPAVGVLIDRWGSRPVAIPGIVLCSFAFAGFGLANGNVAQWMVLWCVFAVMAILVKVTVWTAAVSSVFEAGRGMAIAVTLCGNAIAQTFAPFFAQDLIDAHGWRMAYAALAFGWGAVVLALLVPFFSDARTLAVRRNTVTAVAPMSGLAMGDAIRDPALQRIAAASFLFMLLTSAVTVHQVPILAERGVSRDTAAWMVASAGVMGVMGKLVSGWLLDRSTSGRTIGGLTLAAPGFALAIFLVPDSSVALLVLAMGALGYATGAGLQVSVYMTSRYGGVRNFGKIFGITASLFALALAIGPLCSALLYDLYGSYRLFLLSCLPISVASGYLVASLGEYPSWDEDC
jgi:MFS family permease